MSPLGEYILEFQITIPQVHWLLSTSHKPRQIWESLSIRLACRQGCRSLTGSMINVGGPSSLGVVQLPALIVVLDSIRKLAEQTVGTEPVRSVPHGFRSLFLAGVHLDFLPCPPSVMECDLKVESQKNPKNQKAKQNNKTDKQNTPLPLSCPG